MSRKTRGYVAYAVAGTNTVSFAIDPAEADTSGLLGFAVRRIDPAEGEDYVLPGFKVFRSVLPEPGPEVFVSSAEHPIQSFVWDDFTAKPGRTYEYRFSPLHGQPKAIDRSAPPIRIRVQTEPLYSRQSHDVFFNRGAVGSQAYARRFGNRAPDAMEPADAAAAREWLSRHLDDAILRFIRAPKRGERLLCCFYELRYLPVVRELRYALDRGVDVRVIVDAKQNTEGFPRDENLVAIAAAGLPASAVILREARRDDIQHNKLMIRVDVSGAAREVWTGSTNISDGGIHGQANVGHWVRSARVADRFRAYWDLLATDPGSRMGESRATVLAKNAAFRAAVAEISPAPAGREAIPRGTTPVFSPRAGTALLDLYADLLDGADDLACITLAFGIGGALRERLADNTPLDALTFVLLERRDRPSAGTSAALNASKNVYAAWGSFLREPLHRWAKETSALGLGLNRHVAFIHSKFLLVDPLGPDPIVVTGSANFSEASVTGNDENMLLIRGHRRAADIYLTEFNRLFNHYYFRSVAEARREEMVGERRAGPLEPSIFLAETDSWLAKYTPGSLRAKRVRVFARMHGAADGHPEGG